MPTTPTDPLYASQWHFTLIGDIQTIWDEYSGVGVHVGVYDSGTDYNHEDLAANYDSSLHVVDGANNPIDPGVPNGSADNPHGTATAGLIGAAMNNGVGGTGVAWGTSLTAVNIFNPVLYGYVNAADPSGFMDVAGQAAGLFDITSNSWGATPLFGSYQSLTNGSFADGLDEVYGLNAANGRGGLGTITVQAAGNDNLDANGDGVNASRFTITVAATEQTGFAAWYSNYGASILVTAPAAAVTTDITGGDGYDPTNYTTDFNGTSAATPVVSGVVALMLDANSDLGWRDVQNILANSSHLTGSAFNAGAPSATEEGLWQANHSGTWNGGGNHIHTNYGYGMVNAYNAVRMAEVWTLFAPAATSANEAHSMSFHDFDDTVLPGSSTPFQTTFTVADNMEIDHLAITLDLTTTYISDLYFTLTSAQGTTITVNANDLDSIDTEVDGLWTWGIDGLRGELSAGTWTLTAHDTYTASDSVTLRSATLDFYGSMVSTNDVYHFTDEYLAMVGFDAARATITDLNGGTDWLNFAAVRGGINLNMADGQTFTVAGVNWGTLSGAFENAVGGDGNDTIAGSSLDNIIHGMRGNDTVYGGDGNDSVDGGDGDDLIDLGAGDDYLDIVSSGDDTFYGGAGDDYIYGYIGNETYYGEDGNDTLLGYSGDDQLDGGEGADSIEGDEGNDTIHGGSGVDTLYGGTGNDTLDGGLSEDSCYGDEGNDTFQVTAEDFGDNVYGGADIDTLDLGGWAYSLIGFNVNLSTQIYEFLPNGFGIDGTYDAQSIENVIGSSFNDAITGNELENNLNGGASDDTISGAAGDDTSHRTVAARCDLRRQTRDCADDPLFRSR